MAILPSSAGVFAARYELSNAMEIGYSNCAAPRCRRVIRAKFAVRVRSPAKDLAIAP
jgi:hypothetical protein